MSQTAHDPFLEALKALGAKPTGRCAFGAWLDALTPERQAAMAEVLAQPYQAIPATKIQEFAAANGYAAREGVIQDHRAERCACVR